MRINVHGGIATATHPQRFVPEIIDLIKESNIRRCRITTPDKKIVIEGIRTPGL